ncbi:MAG: hypothetical protein KC621_10730 [Myxococcales bacterium]|nr:hypothetical protein [Myxococcales bacterium]
MTLSRGGYAAALKEGALDTRGLSAVERHLLGHFTLEPVPPEVVGRWRNHPPITDALQRLHLRVARYRKDSWEGLVVGFPGSAAELSTDHVSTPLLRKLLYPIIDLARRLQEHSGARLPCIYLIGSRFPDVFLRKFALLDQVTPHLVVLTQDLIQKAHTQPPAAPVRVDNEYRAQAALCAELASPSGLVLASPEGATTRLRYLSHEVPCWEGTKEPERLDILAVDGDDKSLTAFELKGPSAGRVDVENLFLQGIEHLNWLEANKMAVKLVMDGPRGTRINTRKRARLVLGLFQDHVSPLFEELRREAERKQTHLRIHFASMAVGADGRLSVRLL